MYIIAFVTCVLGDDGKQLVCGCQLWPKLEGGTKIVCQRLVAIIQQLAAPAHTHTHAHMCTRQKNKVSIGNPPFSFTVESRTCTQSTKTERKREGGSPVTQQHTSQSSGTSCVSPASPQQHLLPRSSSLQSTSKRTLHTFLFGTAVFGL